MEKTQLEKENDKNAIALFRFAIIAPLINNTCEYKSKAEFFRTASLKKIYTSKWKRNNNIRRNYKKMVHKLL